MNKRSFLVKYLGTFFILFNSMNMFSIQKVDSLNIKKKSNSTVLNRSYEFPFGYSGLDNNLLPPTWESNPDKFSENDSIVSEIINYYDKINHYNLENNLIYPNWKINTINYIKNGYSYEPFINSRKLEHLGDIRYRLPNIEKYQIYYSTYQKSKEDFDSVDLLGNLIFYDSLSKTANVINVYFHKYDSANWNEHYLFFKIDKDLKLELYTYRSIAEDYNQFEKVSEIQLINDKRILINNVGNTVNSIPNKGGLDSLTAPNQIISIKDLKFGCEYINKIPIEWKKKWLGDDSIVEKSYLCFDRINSKENIETPSIKTFEVIGIGKYDLCSCNVAEENPSLEIKYRLPDLGKFEVYYSYRNIQYNNNLSQKDCSFRCLEYGNLILFDTSNSHAKIIPIYFDARPKEAVSVYNRFFYITSYKSIELWDIDSGELEGNLQAKHNIEISKDGDIKIEELFNYPEYKTNEYQLKKNNR